MATLDAEPLQRLADVIANEAAHRPPLNLLHPVSGQPEPTRDLGLGVAMLIPEAVAQLDHLAVTLIEREQPAV